MLAAILWKGTDASRMTGLEHPAGAFSAPSSSAVYDLLYGMWVARALQIAASFGLTDLLREEPQSLQTLAERTGTHPPSLYRLLRALSSVGVFEEHEPAQFANTERSLSLGTGQPESLHALALMQGSDWYWRACNGLAYSIQTGQPAFDLFHGSDLPTYLATHPTAKQAYTNALQSVLAMSSHALLDAYDFSPFSVVMDMVDVNKGTGSLLFPLLQRYPTLRGILSLFSQTPVATEEWQDRIEREGLATRCTLIAGDDSMHIPTEADVILLARILRERTEEECLHLLRTCRQVLPAQGKVLIVEQVIASLPTRPTTAVFADLELLVETTGGRERTKQEYISLLEAAGLALARILATPSPYTILEARPL